MPSFKDRHGYNPHRRQNVIQSLQVGKSQRSNQDIQDIMNFILTNCRASMFRDLSEESFSKLCRGITLEEYKPNQIIVKQGSISDYMLILIKGKVDIFRSDNASDMQPGRFINTLSKAGDFVGEMWLAENIPRNSTVIASQETWCMKIDGSRSRNAIKKHIRSEQLARMQKIASLPYFMAEKGGLGSEEFLPDLAQALKSKTLRARDILYKEGQSAEEVSFIISGSIGLRKRDNSSVNPLLSQFLVCIAGVGEIIGGETLDPSTTEPKYHFTAIAETTVELFTLPRASIRVLDRNMCRDEIWKISQIRLVARLLSCSDPRRHTSANLKDYAESAKNKARTSDHSKKHASASSATEELLRLPTSSVGLRFAPNPPCRRCRADITGIRPLSNRRLIPLAYKDGILIQATHRDYCCIHRQ